MVSASPNEWPAPVLAVASVAIVLCIVSLEATKWSPVGVAGAGVCSSGLACAVGPMWESNFVATVETTETTLLAAPNEALVAPVLAVAATEGISSTDLSASG